MKILLYKFKVEFVFCNFKVEFKFYKFFRENLCLCKFKDYFLKGTTCHTELSQESEVSIKSKRGYFANAQYDNDLFAIFLPCHTERKRSIHKFKERIAPLKRGFFALC